VAAHAAAPSGTADEHGFLVAERNRLLTPVAMRSKLGSGHHSARLDVPPDPTSTKADGAFFVVVARSGMKLEETIGTELHGKRAKTTT